MITYMSSNPIICYIPKSYKQIVISKNLILLTDG